MDGTGVQLHEWKPKRSLLDRKTGHFWCVTVLTITTYWAWVFARMAERYIPGLSIARARSACTHSVALMDTSPLWSSLSVRWMIPRLVSSATREPVLLDRHHFLCAWHVPCRGLRRSEPCSISAASWFASTPGSTISSACLCQRPSKAGLRNDRTSAACVVYCETLYVCVLLTTTAKLDDRNINTTRHQYFAIRTCDWPLTWEHYCIVGAVWIHKNERQKNKFMLEIAKLLGNEI